MNLVVMMNYGEFNNYGELGDSENSGNSGKCCDSFQSGTSVEFGNW